MILTLYAEMLCSFSKALKKPFSGILQALVATSRFCVTRYGNSQVFELQNFRRRDAEFYQVPFKHLGQHVFLGFFTNRHIPLARRHHRYSYSPSCLSYKGLSACLKTPLCTVPGTAVCCIRILYVERVQFIFSVLLDYKIYLKYFALEVEFQKRTLAR